jgi:hypothetical protein
MVQKRQRPDPNAGLAPGLRRIFKIQILKVSSIVNLNFFKILTHLFG